MPRHITTALACVLLTISFAIAETAPQRVTTATAQNTTGGVNVAMGDINNDGTEQATNFGVLLGDSDDPPSEESEGAELLEEIALRERNLEGVFLLIKTDDEFRVIELPARTRAPYVVGQDGEGAWLAAELATEDVKYGPVLKIKPKGLTEEQPLHEVFGIARPPQEGIEPDEIDAKASDAVAIGLLLPAVQKIRSATTDEEAVGLLLPAVQKVRSATTDEEAIGLLLPAVQKASAAPGVEPDEIDANLEQEGIEPDEIDVALTDEQPKGFFARLTAFFRG